MWLTTFVLKNTAVHLWCLPLALMSGTLSPPRPDAVAPQPRRLAPLATPPGRLIRLLAILWLACIALGVSAVWTAASHDSAAHGVALLDDRLSLDAQQIYRSLAEADATAAGAYLSGGVEPADLRQHYLDDLARAQTALRDATTAAGGDQAAAAAIDPLTTQISVYAGLVETARADNREGLPVGGAYLSEASTVMRTRLLPAAEKLYALETGRLHDDQARANAFPYPLLVIFIVTVAALVYAQRKLSRDTKRTFNVGLLVATGIVAVMALWTLIALGLQHADIHDSHNLGSAQLEELSRAEIAALRAHGDESLFLVSGGEDPTYSNDYTAIAGDLARHLAQAAAINTPAAPKVASALAHSRNWKDAHERLMLADQSGRFSDAVASATDPAANGAQTQFAAVRDALTTAIATDQRALDDAAGAAQTDVAFLSFGMGFLALAAAIACGAGMAPRITEYGPITALWGRSR